MKKRIFSIMDTSKKKSGIAIIGIALVLTIATWFVFAATASQTAEQNTTDFMEIQENANQKSEIRIVEDTNIAIKNENEIQPSPRNVYDYVNKISADYDISNYDIGDLKDETSNVNDNVAIPDEILLQQQMGDNIFQEAAEYFNISFQEAVDLFVEGSSEIETTETFKMDEGIIYTMTLQHTAPIKEGDEYAWLVISEPGQLASSIRALGLGSPSPELLGIDTSCFFEQDAICFEEIIKKFNLDSDISLTNDAPITITYLQDDISNRIK